MFTEVFSYTTVPWSTFSFSLTVRIKHSKGNLTLSYNFGPNCNKMRHYETTNLTGLVAKNGLMP